jgi:hypothetical protein
MEEGLVAGVNFTLPFQILGGPVNRARQSEKVTPNQNTDFLGQYVK